MPWSGSAGSKTFSRTDGTRSGSQTWQQADGAGVDIIASDHDTHDQDLADGLSSALLKDGGNTATANLPMGGFRHTNVGAAAARTDYARLSDLQDAKGVYCPTVGGTGNAITLTTGYTVSAYAAGQLFTFIVGTANTGATTVNVDGLGAKALVRSDGSNTALVGSDLIAGMIAEIVYDGTRFHLMSTQLSSAASGDVLARIVKVGAVAIWPMTTVPTGWLEADGSAISRTTYAELFAVYGTAYGTGDGSTTFNIPNYKDYFIRGYDAAGTDASSRTDRGDGTTGASVGTKQAGGIESHTHTGQTENGGSHDHDISLSSGSSDTGAGVSGNDNNTSGFTNTNGVVAGGVHYHDFTTGATGGTETRPKNITAKFIILALPAAASASTLGTNGLLYSWDTGTTDADPGSGKLRLDNATVASATQLYISETGANGEDLSSVLDTWDASTNSAKGDLYVYKVGAPGTFVYFQVTSTRTDAGTYNKFTISYVSANGTLANGDNVSVLFFRTGDTGPTGAEGPMPGIQFTYSATTTDSDPGAGTFRLNSATLSSVTAAYVDNTDINGNTITGWLDSFDDGNDTARRGDLLIQDASDRSNYALFRVTGSVVDGTGYRKITLTHLSSAGTLSGACVWSFSMAGDKGAAGAGSGDLLSTNNLSDVASASTARTNLGLAIGVNVQAYDAELAAIAGLTSAADKGIQFTGSGTAATYDLTAAGKALLDDADASAQRTTLGLVIGTNVQAYDADLDAIAGLTSAADKVPYFTGSGTAATADFTSAGRSMVAAASAAVQTALLSVVTGDSGSGGVKGLVPAPASGDAAANRFLKADGTWTAPSGSGDVTGPASSTDNGIPRFDGTGGKTLKTSALTIDDTSGTIIGFANAAALSDSNGNELIKFGVTASAVNEVTATNAATGNKPVLSATGGDTNIILQVKGKGTGGAEIQGTSTNDSAATGYVGEYTESSIALGSGIAMSTATNYDITSITLSAGDWDLWGSYTIELAGGATLTGWTGWASTTSATLPTKPAGGAYSEWRGSTTSGVQLPIGMRRYSVSGSTTVYLSARPIFTGGSTTGFGIICARRVR